MFRSESIPHDDGPKILLVLQFVEDGDHLGSYIGVLFVNLLKPCLLSLIIVVDFKAKAIVVQINSMNDLLPLLNNYFFHLGVQLIILMHFVHLRKIRLTI